MLRLIPGPRACSEHQCPYTPAACWEGVGEDLPTQAPWRKDIRGQKIERTGCVPCATGKLRFSCSPPSVSTTLSEAGGTGVGRGGVWNPPNLLLLSPAPDPHTKMPPQAPAGHHTACHPSYSPPPPQSGNPLTPHFRTSQTPPTQAPHPIV